MAKKEQEEIITIDDLKHPGPQPQLDLLRFFHPGNLVAFIIFIWMIYSPALYFFYPGLKHGEYFGPFTIFPLMGTIIKLAAIYIFLAYGFIKITNFIIIKKHQQTKK